MAATTQPGRTPPGTAPGPDPDAPLRRRPPAPPPEQGGPRGLEPTRYGDWERNGRCIDF